ncbi:acylphosphatase [Oceanobacillus sp. ISL-74]|uniref:acylphosphatase n=1 Tax=Oceanobacillus sp. ISL-74 TaxID=2819162 RepID=UPI001BEBB909|nr:acylphosphatase [Oceanobacillus sp. ISL-74]MBT2599379.1 acylphosphatase [Oceanobacillus sp. ISL-74]
MDFQKVEPLPHLTKQVVEGISGFNLCSYLVALEGWRRGLTLKWYRDESSKCKLARLNSSTHGKFYSLSDGSKTHYFFRSRGDKVANKSVKICQDKELTKSYLRKRNVSIPLGKVLESDIEIVDYANYIGYPVIVKPLKASMGKGVYTNINSEKELKGVLKELRSKFSYKDYLVEKHYPGKEYRIYVVGDKVVGATNRIPANIVGDGVNTVEKLIEAKNQARKTNPYLAPKPIKVDYEVQYMLKRVDYYLDSIPKEEEQVFLREKSNLSSGGDPVEATEELSEQIRQLAVDALKALPSIPQGGVDIIVDPTDNNKGVVLEINATAEIGFHPFPLTGKSKDVPTAIIDYYFPETKNKYRSPFYFDYLSLLNPLKSLAVEELKVSNTPQQKNYARKYTVKGKLNRVGYLTYIKRQALSKKLYGHAKKLTKNEIEIYLIGESKEVLQDFKEYIQRGSNKSVVKSIEEQELAFSEVPTLTGFQIITE